MTGLSVEEAMTRANDHALRIDKGRRDTDEDLVDVLYASCAVLRGPGQLQESSFRRLTEAYRVLAATEWVPDALEEREELLTCLAFGAWSQCLRHRSYQEMSSWEASCAARVLRTDSVSSFLELPLWKRSAGLCDRFLGDPAVVLALCHRLKEERNRSPLSVAREAEWALAWLDAGGDTLMTSERSYVKGEIALSAGSAARLLGRFGDATLWIERAKNTFASCAATARLVPIAAFEELAVRHDRLEMRSVIEELPEVIAGIEKLGPSFKLLRCRYMEAEALKSLGRHREAGQRFRALLHCQLLDEDYLLHGLVLANLGEIEAANGEHQLAARYLTDALPYVEKSSTGPAIAYLKAALGEVLRERGSLGRAIESYRGAIALYAAQGMEWQVGYMRIILAESLIATGHDDEAVGELLAALPVLEREHIVPAAIAAVGLLKESLARQRVDPQVVRRLRDSLAPSLPGTRL
jgi:tetratricopeptide (TPR) repeat protein